jgi:hypothetical protein
MDWNEDELGVLALRRQILALTNRADFGFFRDLGRQLDRSRQLRSYSSEETEELGEEGTEAVGCPIV